MSSLMFLIYLITSFIYVYIGVSSFIYSPKSKLNRIFLLLCLDLAFWAVILTFMNIMPDAETATIFRRIATFFWSVTYALFLHLILILVGKDNFLKKPIYYILIYVPALISIWLYFFFSPITHDKTIKLSVGWAYSTNCGRGLIVDSFFPVYCLVYVSICIILLYKWGKKSSVKRIKHQTKLIISAIVAVLILGSMTDIILPVFGVSKLPALTVTFIIIPVYAMWYLNKRFRLMNLEPRNVVLDVIETMGEGVIITDHGNSIQDINKGAQQMLGFALDEVINKHISVLTENCDDIYGMESNNRKELNLIKRCGDTLPVLLTITSLHDEWDEVYGNVIIFQDLTEIKLIQSKIINSHEELERKVLERTKELNNVNEELRNEISSRIEMEQEIRKLAYYDQLTGLPNKKLFMSYLNKKIHENQRNELSLAIMYLDLDSFKMVNDTMGYSKGEELLSQVSKRLLKSLRISDTVSRVAGDEFLILIQNNPNEKKIDVVASKLINVFCKPFIVSGKEVHITASIGVSTYPIDGEDADTLVKNADIAMYRAKERGKNKYEICTPLLRTSLVETMKFTNQLYRAVGKKEFILNYQPQVDIKTGKIVGFEALIRWNHPELGEIQPSKFIPIGEKTGLIIPISEWVLETVCKQNKAWQEQGVAHVPIAVNLSAKQLIDYNLVEVVSGVLNTTGLDPGYLEMEITENILLEDIDVISDTLNKLSKMGIKISIDDFGTKYSSLSYLKKLPINRVKIDISFVQGITVNHKDEAIIKAIIDLARNLGIDVLAEGVETLSQMEFLKKADCHVIQGFYLYRPMEAKKVYELLLK